MLVTVVNEEQWSLWWSGQRNGLWNVKSSAYTTLRELTYFLFFYSVFSVGPGLVDESSRDQIPTTVYTQQLIQHSSSISKRSQGRPASRQLQTVPEQQRRLCLSNCPTVRKCQDLQQAVHSPKWDVSRKRWQEANGHCVQKGKTRCSWNAHQQTQPEWVVEADTMTFLGMSEHIYLRELRSDLLSSH